MSCYSSDSIMVVYEKINKPIEITKPQHFKCETDQSSCQKSVRKWLLGIKGGSDFTSETINSQSSRSADSSTGSLSDFIEKDAHVMCQSDATYNQSDVSTDFSGSQASDSGNQSSAISSVSKTIAGRLIIKAAEGVVARRALNNRLGPLFYRTV